MARDNPNEKIEIAEKPEGLTDPYKSSHYCPRSYREVMDKVKEEMFIELEEKYILVKKDANIK